METNHWRISTINGALLAAYFVPAWVIPAGQIIVSPVQGFYERQSVSVALFVNDHLHLAGLYTVRAAWLLALAKLTVVAFFAVFVVLTARASIRKARGGEEALGFALGIGSLISFASMVMASMVGEHEALRLHATELLLMLGGISLMALEPPLLASRDVVEDNLPINVSASAFQGMHPEPQPHAA